MCLAIDFCENGIYVNMEVTKDGFLHLNHIGIHPFVPNSIGTNEDEQSRFNILEANISGFDRPKERHGNGFTVTNLGCSLKYQSHTKEINQYGALYTFSLLDQEKQIEAKVYYQFFNNLQVVRSYSEVINHNDSETYTLEYLSSFCLNGLTKGDKSSYAHNLKLKVPHNSWCRELQWRDYDLHDCGMVPSIKKGLQRSSKIVRLSNTGAWSAKEYLPMIYVANQEQDYGMLCQIEHNGSWHIEIGEQANQVYLQLSGPNELYSHFFTELAHEQKFVSVPCAIAFGVNDFNAVVGQMTDYRRIIRRDNADNKKLPVIFNDYMNCLNGDPTTEKLLPLIDRAADAGCEYFCIDAGWYDKGYWWDGVGQWLPSTERFPEGIEFVLNYIKSKNMIPGLWLEIEVMGIKSPKLKETDDSWFFMRHGKRVFDRSRYQLDFTNPKVRAHATSVIKRLVEDYGVGYIKMDYNIEPGIGTTQYTQSAGLGLLNHNRAYLQWLSEIFTSYPNLVIENCSSGGLRMDYALLSLSSIQSTSDQEDYLNYATIATNAPSAVTPEQAAIWAYPMINDDQDAVAFNEVSAMMHRIHQSGHLAKISQENFELVKEAITCYKEIRADLKQAHPYWPLGLSTFESPWSCLALDYKDEQGKVAGYYIALWHRDITNDKPSHDNEITLDFAHLQTKEANISKLYPNYLAAPCNWDSSQGALKVSLKPKQAVLLKLALS